MSAMEKMKARTRATLEAASRADADRPVDTGTAQRPGKNSLVLCFWKGCGRRLNGADERGPDMGRREGRRRDE